MVGLLVVLFVLLLLLSFLELPGLCRFLRVTHSVYACESMHAAISMHAEQSMGIASKGDATAHACKRDVNPRLVVEHRSRFAVGLSATNTVHFCMCHRNITWG